MRLITKRKMPIIPTMPQAIRELYASIELKNFNKENWLELSCG